MTLVIPLESTEFAIVLVASFGLSLVFFLLFLDARGHWREIKGRNWKAVTPRFDVSMEADGRQTSSGVGGATVSNHNE